MTLFEALGHGRARPSGPRARPVLRAGRAARVARRRARARRDAAARVRVRHARRRAGGVVDPRGPRRRRARGRHGSPVPLRRRGLQLSPRDERRRAAVRSRAGRASCWARARPSLVLESGGARGGARRARAAIVAGCGAAADAVHMTAPDREGAGAARAIRAALDDAGRTPADVGFVSRARHGHAVQRRDGGGRA